MPVQVVVFVARHWYSHLSLKFNDTGATACLAAGDYSDAAVEEFARAVRRTPPSEQLDRRLLEDGLQHLDSRGLAALLKELAKAHHGKRAREVRAATSPTSCAPILGMVAGSLVQAH